MRKDPRTQADIFPKATVNKHPFGSRALHVSQSETATLANAPLVGQQSPETQVHDITTAGHHDAWKANSERAHSSMSSPDSNLLSPPFSPADTTPEHSVGSSQESMDSSSSSHHTEDFQNPRESPIYTTLEFGRPGSLKYRMLLFDQQGWEISPWHGIPLHTEDGSTLNFVCTTPKGNWARLTTASEEKFNPLRLVERESSGQPAHFAQDVRWNYGLLPQTWGDPEQFNTEYGGLPMDNSPVEVLEIGSRRSATGEVYPVKPLAAFPLVEPGSLGMAARLSWKIVAIDAADPMAENVFDVASVNQQWPGVLDDVQSWLRTCHCLQAGDKECSFGRNGRPVEREETLSVVAQAHASWQTYVSENPPRGGVPDKNRPARGEARLEPRKYEAMWTQYTKGVSTEAIPLSDSKAGSELVFDRAWAVDRACAVPLPSGEDGRWQGERASTGGAGPATGAGESGEEERGGTWGSSKANRTAPSKGGEGESGSKRAWLRRTITSLASLKGSAMQSVPEEQGLGEEGIGSELAPGDPKSPKGKGLRSLLRWRSLDAPKEMASLTQTAKVRSNPKAWKKNSPESLGGGSWGRKGRVMVQFSEAPRLSRQNTSEMPRLSRMDTMPAPASHLRALEEFRTAWKGQEEVDIMLMEAKRKVVPPTMEQIVDHITTALCEQKIMEEPEWAEGVEALDRNGPASVGAQDWLDQSHSQGSHTRGLNGGEADEVISPSLAGDEKLAPLSEDIWSETFDQGVEAADGNSSLGEREGGVSPHGSAPEWGEQQEHAEASNSDSARAADFGSQSSPGSPPFSAQTASTLRDDISEDDLDFSGKLMKCSSLPQVPSTDMPLVRFPSQRQLAAPPTAGLPLHFARAQDALAADLEYERFLAQHGYTEASLAQKPSPATKKSVWSPQQPRVYKSIRGTGFTPKTPVPPSVLDSPQGTVPSQWEDNNEMGTGSSGKGGFQRKKNAVGPMT